MAGTRTVGYPQTTRTSTPGCSHEKSNRRAGLGHSITILTRHNCRTTRPRLGPHRPVAVDAGLSAACRQADHPGRIHAPVPQSALEFSPCAGAVSVAAGGAGAGAGGGVAAG